jgi:hypothetical protein
VSHSILWRLSLTPRKILFKTRAVSTKHRPESLGLDRQLCLINRLLRIENERLGFICIAPYVCLCRFVGQSLPNLSSDNLFSLKEQDRQWFPSSSRETRGWKDGRQ